MAACQAQDDKKNLAASFADNLILLLKALPEGPIALAVSGGADSMAMLHLAHVTKAQHGRSILAFTIDHDLREGSAAEAAQVTKFCVSQNIPHQILVWHGPKPQTAVQEQARAFRYTKLIDAAQREKAVALLTGHSASDQAETLLARLSRGAGLDGLAAISPKRWMAHGAGEALAVLRPLLAYSRHELRDYCGANEVPFSDDPSNDDPAYERVRYRALLAALEAQNILSVSSLCKSAERLRQQQSSLDAAIADAFTRCDGAFDEAGAITLKLDKVKTISENLAAALLGRMMRAAGGGDMNAGADEADLLAAALNKTSATKYGAIFHVAKDMLYVMREPSGVVGRSDGSNQIAPQTVTPEKPILWDNRFIVTPRREGQIAPLGVPLKGTKVESSLFATVPALWQGECCIAMPEAVKKRTDLEKLPWTGETTGLHIVSLLPERLLQRVVRFN